MTTAGLVPGVETELTVGDSGVAGAACPDPDQSPSTAARAVRIPSSWPPQVRIVATFYNVEGEGRTNLQVIKR
jgi:hypothetical protein